EDVLPVEIEGDGAGDEDRSPVLPGGGRARVDGRAAEVRDRFQRQADDVLSGGDAADRPGQDVVEHEGADGDLAGAAAQRLADDAVDAAADEHRTALDVHPPHGVAEAHDGQNEPRRRPADGLLDDAADVVGGGGEVAQDDGGGAPAADEG